MSAHAHPPLSPPRPLGEVRSWPRTFTDRLTSPLPGVSDFVRLALRGERLLPSAEGRAQIPDLPFRPEPLPDVTAGELSVTWAGHASHVVRIGGLTVLTDPVWSQRIVGTPGG